MKFNMMATAMLLSVSLAATNVQAQELMFPKGEGA